MLLPKFLSERNFLLSFFRERLSRKKLKENIARLFKNKSATGVLLSSPNVSTTGAW